MDNIIEYKKTMDPKTRETIKNVLLFAEKKRIPVTFYAHTRRFIDRFSCVDTPLKPFTLGGFWIAGDIIYFKNGFTVKTIGFDDIDKITIDPVYNNIMQEAVLNE